MQVHIDLNVTTENSNLFWLPAVNNSVHLHRSLGSPSPSRCHRVRQLCSQNANASEGKINQYLVRIWEMNFIDFSFSHHSRSRCHLKLVFPRKSGADTITQFHHFIGFFILVDVARKEPWTTSFFRFHSAFPSFHPRWVSVEFSWHPLPSLSSRSTSENNFFNSLMNWHLCQV